MIEILPAYDRQADVRALFQEYTQMLVDRVPAFAGYLELQCYDRELVDLREKYGGVGGRLYLALADGQAAGCIALHPLDRQRCEMKRLYVRPAFRGLHLGRTLAERVVDEARAIGYRTLLLDTLPPLEDAIRLYRSMGFTDIPPYLESPLAETIYLGLDLTGDGPRKKER